MSNPAPQLVQKLWNYCNILRDDGLSYGDYVEQLTFLLSLKMAELERRLIMVEELESVVAATSSAPPASANLFYRKHSQEN